MKALGEEAHPLLKLARVAIMFVLGFLASTRYILGLFGFCVRRYARGWKRHAFGNAVASVITTVVVFPNRTRNDIIWQMMVVISVLLGQWIRSNGLISPNVC